MFLIVAMLAWAPQLCRAEVERFAVVAGNNSGAPDEADLRFAESDTAKVYDVLLDLGGFRSENVVLLRGRDAQAMRRALIAVNQRIRSSVAAGREVMLLVYYSGHGNERALHMGRSELPFVELEQLVSGSAAQFRLLIVDACRSGSLPQAKGGKSAPPFAITLDDRLAGEGAVYLTASAATEDAQESLQLQGSFFTHYLVSGMLGAADGNGDGQVVLSEAYRYAYDHTLRASSRTLAGMQHPSFRYELSGQGDVVLSWPRADVAQRAQVQFPTDRTYLVFQGNAEGPVIAEIGFADRRRTLSLRPGRYFIRGRDRRYLLEGAVELAAGQTKVVGDGDLARIDYARLVRKGGGPLRSVAAVVGGYQMRTPSTVANRCATAHLPATGSTMSTLPWWQGWAAAARDFSIAISMLPTTSSMPALACSIPGTCAGRSRWISAWAWALASSGRHLPRAAKRPTERALPAM